LTQSRAVTAGPEPVAPVKNEKARRRRPTRKKTFTCAECFFGARGLCALGLDEPCPTFRLDSPEGLVPPRQPTLLMRDPADPDSPSTSA